MPTSLHSRAVEDIGRRIVDGRLAAGSIVLADQLAIELGVGRSVVREAVRVLQSLGLVAPVRRLGIRILPSAQWRVLDPQVITWRLATPSQGAQLRSLTELRSAVEPMAAELAASQATSADGGELLQTAASMRSVGRSGDLAAFLELDIHFHSLVLRSSGNEMFAAMDGMVAAVLRGRTELGLMPSRPHEEALQWHVDVADAVHGGHAPAARSSMELIMRRTIVEVEHVWDDAPRAE